MYFKDEIVNEPDRRDYMSLIWIGLGVISLIGGGLCVYLLSVESEQ